MKEKKLVPKRRFSNYIDKWKQCKLEDIAEFNPKSILPEEFKYVDLESVVGIELVGYKYVSKKLAPSRAQRLASYGDLFYQTVRPYQKNNFLFELREKNYVFSTGYAQMRPTVDSYFLFNCIQEASFIAKVLDRCTGTGYPSINSNELANIEIKTPENKLEQQKIGNFFKHLDQIISLEQRKLEKTKALKSAYLAEMFPAEGERVPKRRFAGFTGEWEERNFFDNIRRTIDFRGRTPKKLGLDWSDTGYLALSALNVKNGYIDFHTDGHYGNQELYDKWMTGSELKKGQVLFTTEAPMGNVAQVPDNRGYILSQRTISFDVEPEKITNDFLVSLLRSDKTYKVLSNLSSGGTAKGVSQRSLEQLKVFVPKKLKEQQAIGELFKKLDESITNQQQKLDKLKAMKQAYLQEMFV